MSEIGTGVKLAVGMLLTAAVLSLLFFIYSVSSTISTIEYNETNTNMKNIEFRIEDGVLVSYPMVSLKQQLSKYIDEGYITSIVIKEFNAYGTEIVKANVTSDLYRPFKEYDMYTACITNYNPTTKQITIRLGG